MLVLEFAWDYDRQLPFFSCGRFLGWLCESVTAYRASSDQSYVVESTSIRSGFDTKLVGLCFGTLWEV